MKNIFLNENIEFEKQIKNWKLKVVVKTMGINIYSVFMSKLKIQLMYERLIKWDENSFQYKIYHNSIQKHVILK